MSTVVNSTATTDVLFHETDAVEVKTDTRWHARLGWWIVLGGFGSFFVWASLAPLDKGVPLGGTVTVESSKKAIQHATGGTVEAILVKEGDVVKAGDVLLKMNHVQATADAEMSRVQYFVARAAEARLMAEGAGKKTIDFPKELKAVKDDPRVASSIALQQQLFNSRQAAKQSEWSSIDENVAGLVAQNRGLEESRNAKQKQLQFVKEQLDSLRDLAKGGFVARTRLLDVEQTHAQVTAAIAEDIGNIGREKDRFPSWR